MNGTRLASACLLVGCGRISFDPGIDSNAGSADADGSDGLTACERAWLTDPHFSPPTPITLANTPGVENGPFLSNDGLTLYYQSDQAGNADLYALSRPTLGATFDTVVPVVGMNTAFGEVEVRFSPNSLEAWLSTSRPGGVGSYDLWQATRANPTDAFGSFAAVPELNSSGDEYNAAVLGDGLVMYFAAIGRPGNIGMTDIWRAQRATLASPFDPPVLDAALSTPDQDASPTFTASDRILVLTRGQASNLDLVYFTRADRTAAFGTATIIPDVGMNLDLTPYLRRDGCELVFASRRSGGQDLYIAEMQL